MQKLRDVVFPDGHLNKDVVGKSAREIGAMAGIDIPESVRDHPAAGRRRRRRRTSWPRRSSARSSRSCPTRPSRRRSRAPRPTCWSKAPGTRRRCTRTTRRTSAQLGVELPVSRLVVNQASRADRRRLADQRLCADDDARLRLLGRQLDLREPGLQAPDERVAHRQGDHGQEGADRRRDLGPSPDRRCATWSWFKSRSGARPLKPSPQLNREVLMRFNGLVRLHRSALRAEAVERSSATSLSRRSLLASCTCCLAGEALSAPVLGSTPASSPAPANALHTRLDDAARAIEGRVIAWRRDIPPAPRARQPRDPHRRHRRRAPEAARPRRGAHRRAPTPAWSAC